jgi:hypothetical protein
MAKGHLGVATRCGSPQDVEDARRELNAAKVEKAIRAAVDAAPPLSAAQRERLSLLLWPGVERRVSP